MKNPIQVLYVIDQLRQLGGAERNLLRLLRGLPPDRFETHLLTFEFNQNVFSQMPCQPLIFPIRRIYGRSGMRQILPFRRLLHEKNIAIVHTFFESADLWAAPLARLFSDAIVVSGRRDLGIQRHSLHDFGYRLISPLFDQIQAVSDDVRHYLIKKDHLPADRIITVPNGIELEAVHPAPREEVRARYGWSNSDPLIVSLGNIRRVKGYDVLIRAASLVCRQIPQARFVIAGRILEGDHYQDLLNSVAAAHLEKNVQFLGPIDAVFDFLNCGDVFVLPSYSEGMSNALMEGMVCGLPVIVTQVGGNSELVTEGENGYLVPVGDAEAAAGRILELLRNPELAHAMGQSGRLTIETGFSMKGEIDMVVAEYERLLAKRHGAARQAGLATSPPGPAL